MADFTLTTPALLFPAISLLMLSYTNRFVVLAALIRELHGKYKEKPAPHLEGQLINLRNRIHIIKYMQIFGALSFFTSAACMFLIFAGMQRAAHWVFGGSLLLLLVSLGFLVWELQLSVVAIELQVADVRKLEADKKKS